MSRGYVLCDLCPVFSYSNEKERENGNGELVCLSSDGLTVGAGSDLKRGVKSKGLTPSSSSYGRQCQHQGEGKALND